MREKDIEDSLVVAKPDRKLWLVRISLRKSCGELSQE